jgi:hypothetical protein
MLGAVRQPLLPFPADLPFMRTLSHIDCCARRTRVLRVWFAACIVLLVCGTTHAEDIDAGPYVPTPQYIVDRMLRMAAVGPNDFVIDLGSGDGRIVITAAKQLGARGMGVDISEKLVDLATVNAHKEGVADKVRFLRQDAFKTDIRQASVLTLYLLPRFVLDLRPKMLAQLRPGARIVSHDYSLGDWKADNVFTFESPEKEVINGNTHTSLFFHVVPAKVAGTWKIAWPRQLSATHTDVVLQQTYQEISGRIGSAQGRPLQHATLRGDRIELLLPMGGSSRLLEGKVEGARIDGTIEIPGRGKLPFTATRIVETRALGWPE